MSEAVKNWFDDGILDSKRFRAALKGRRKYLQLRLYNEGKGDWETLCRAAALMAGFYADEAGANVMLADSTIYASRICARLKPRDRRVVAENMNLDIETLGGYINVPAAVAWVAVCKVKGSVAYDLKIMWRDNVSMCNIIGACMSSFDKLENKRYNLIDIHKMSQPSQ